jgi:hypothetical protein
MTKVGNQRASGRDGRNHAMAALNRGAGLRYPACNDDLAKLLFDFEGFTAANSS